MKIPQAVKMFPMDPAKELIFAVAPDPPIRKFYESMGTKVVIKPPGKSDRASELLVCGAIGWRVARLLPRLCPETPVEHRIIKSDCSQQRWTCGDFSIRQVICTEDALHELAEGQPLLCVINHDGLQIREAMKAFHDFLEKPSGKRPVFEEKVSVEALDLLPQLVELSSRTRYVITCHQRGSGIPESARSRYEQFEAVCKVMAWIDTAANAKLLLKLIRQDYGHALKPMTR